MNTTELIIIAFLMFGLPLLMAPFGIFFYVYMKSLFALIKQLKEKRPDTWIMLGSPEGSSFQAQSPSTRCTTYYTVKPFWPVFVWLLKCQFQGLDTNTIKLAEKTRRFMVLSFIAMLVMFAGAGLFIYFVEVVAKA